LDSHRLVHTQISITPAGVMAPRGFMSSCRVNVIDHLPSPRPFAHARTQRLLDDVNVVCSWLSDPSLRLTPQFNCNVRERFLTLTEIYFSQLLVAFSLWMFRAARIHRSPVLKPPSHLHCLDNLIVVCSWLTDPSLRGTPPWKCNFRERFLTLTFNGKIMCQNGHLNYFSQLLVAFSLWTFCDPMSRSPVLKPPSSSLDNLIVVCSWLFDPSPNLTPPWKCNFRERFLTLTEIYFSQLLVASSLWTFCDPMSRSSVLKPPSGSLRLCQPCGAEFGKGRWIVLFALRTHRPLFVLPL